MEEIRVKKICLQDGITKKNLKQCGVKIKKDKKYKLRNVRVLIFPNYIYLEHAFQDVYFIFAKNGKDLGHIYDPFDVFGGLITFVP